MKEVHRLTVVAIPMALPLTAAGKISASTSHVIGPNEIACSAEYAAMDPKIAYVAGVTPATPELTYAKFKEGQVMTR